MFCNLLLGSYHFYAIYLAFSLHDDFAPMSKMENKVTNLPPLSEFLCGQDEGAFGGKKINNKRTLGLCILSKEKGRVGSSSAKARQHNS
jgi:hypothetical protein